MFREYGLGCNAIVVAIPAGGSRLEQKLQLRMSIVLAMDTWKHAGMATAIGNVAGMGI